MVRPRFLKAGDHGLVVEIGDSIDPEINGRVLSLAEKIEESNFPWIEEIVPTYRSLFISFDPLKIGLEELIEKIRPLIGLEKEREFRRKIFIPVLYGDEFGPDLEEVASLHGLTTEEVIKIHAEKDYLVFMLGFTPGFPYMGIVHPRIATPRLSDPRIKVPAGSVGIAENQTGIYSVESPGGWRIIGRTPLKIFNPQGEPPFLFKAGDLARFYSIDRQHYNELMEEIGRGEFSPQIEEGKWWFPS